jgi:small ligand-binding sensory domain FIST
MLADFNPDDFIMIPCISKPGELEDALPALQHFATGFGVIHGDPYNADTQEMIHQLQAGIDNCFLVGGLTSSHNRQLQVADTVQSGGLSGVLFSENVTVLSNLSQGCRPVGAKHLITEARENVVFTLDHKHALDVFMNDLGISRKEELQTGAADAFVGLCVSGSDISDYTVRNLVGVDTEHRVFAINDYLTESNEMIFCRRDEKSAVDDLQHMLESMAKRLPHKPKGGIYVSCLGRGREQFGDDSEEIKMIHKVLGDFPLTGFFANGEIHYNRLYGYTGVLSLFVE